uniref:AlNc14C66G4684 protein n=1 Tax=Albugo laibachii Nc14 TaxID=890382 RepID=F0WDG4_9STRA|nr:AlNc14C66G4684 [Albugo laibachii Nc14]|eukprot:CCA19236.1 AlNc14C66G4684 [Albugo laibachii Nc14]
MKVIHMKSLWNLVEEDVEKKRHVKNPFNERYVEFVTSPFYSHDAFECAEESLNELRDEKEKDQNQPSNTLLELMQQEALDDLKLYETGEKNEFELQESVLPVQGTEFFTEVLEAGQSKCNNLMRTLAMDDFSLNEAEPFLDAIQAEEDQTTTFEWRAFLLNCLKTIKPFYLEDFMGDIKETTLFSERQVAFDVEMTPLMKIENACASELHIGDEGNSTLSASDESMPVTQPPRKKQCSSRNQIGKRAHGPFSLKTAQQEYDTVFEISSDPKIPKDESNGLLAFQKTPRENSQTKIQKTLESLGRVVSKLTQRRQRKQSGTIHSSKLQFGGNDFEFSIVEPAVNLPSLRKHLMQNNTTSLSRKGSCYDSAKDHQDDNVRHQTSRLPNYLGFLSILISLHRKEEENLKKSVLSIRNQTLKVSKILCFIISIH